MPDRAASYRPLSTDAQIATIIANQIAQDKATITHRTEIKAELNIFHTDLNTKLEHIKNVVDKAATKEEVEKVSDRVAQLEKEHWTKTGRAAAAVFVIGFLSWFLPWYFAGTKK